jgi:hypothetical protein
MEEDLVEFDDPALKAAVRRAWAGERAPAGLAARIVATLEADSVDITRPSVAMTALSPLTATSPLPAGTLFGPPALSPQANSAAKKAGFAHRWRLHWPMIAAIAASVLLVSAWAGWLVNDRMQFDQRMDEAALAMMATHDFCCARPDHHALKGVAPDDLEAIGEKTSADLNIRVLTADPLNGWKFAGAGECQVAHFTSAHLLYRKGNQAISIFSIPAQDFKLYTADSSYTTDAKNHMAAGFVYNHGLYCIVVNSANTPMTMPELRDLRNRVEQAFTAGDPVNLDGIAFDGGATTYAAAGKLDLRRN